MKRGVVLADERSATLLDRIGEPAGRWRLEQHSRLENRHEDEHEHGRPNLLGRGGAPTGPQHLMRHSPQLRAVSRRGRAASRRAMSRRGW